MFVNKARNYRQGGGVFSPSLLMLLSCVMMGFIALHQNASPFHQYGAHGILVPTKVNSFLGLADAAIVDETDLDEVEVRSPTTLTEEELASEIPVMFINTSSKELHVNWVNTVTEEENRVIDTLIPTGRMEIKSHPGHMFVAFNEERTFRIVYFVEEEPEKNMMTFTITEDDISPDRLVMAKFINTSSKSIHINYVNPETKEETMVAHNVAPRVGDIAEAEDDDDDKPQEGVAIIHSHPGHLFAVYDEERSFRTLMSVDAGHIHGSKATFKITEFEIDPLACRAHFINSMNSKRNVNINWVNPETGEEREVITDLPPKQVTSILSRKGHMFVAYDAKRTFRTEFVIHTGSGHNQFLHVTGANGSANADKTHAKFINVSPKLVHINYIDEETKEEHLVIDNLRPRDDQVLETHHGHRFVAYDEERTFRKVFTMNIQKGMVESHHIHNEEL